MEGSALEAMLTRTVTVARGETFTKQLSVDNANLTRDAIVKSLYEVGVQVYTFYSATVHTKIIYRRDCPRHRVAGICQASANRLACRPNFDTVYSPIQLLASARCLHVYHRAIQRSRSPSAVIRGDPLAFCIGRVLSRTRRRRPLVALCLASCLPYSTFLVP